MLILKGNSVKCTHEAQFTQHKEHDTASKMMSSVALKDKLE